MDDLREGSHGIAVRASRIGPVEVPNRIVMAPMTTRAADTEGFVTAQTIAYYVARGGVGLVTVEMASPERCGRHRRRELGTLPARAGAAGEREPR